MEKEIVITAPDGYQIDNDKSTPTNIVFKLINDDNIDNAKTFILECFDNLILKRNKDNNIITYYKDNEWYVKYNQKNNYVWIKYKYIWSILGSKYKLNYDEIKELMTSMIEEVFGWKVFTTELSII
jgi:hypothetical protein